MVYANTLYSRRYQCTKVADGSDHEKKKSINIRRPREINQSAASRSRSMKVNPGSLGDCQNKPNKNLIQIRSDKLSYIKSLILIKRRQGTAA